MGARGPPSTLSIPSFPPQGGLSTTPEVFGNRGRNRSRGSSGASSREQSMEGRGADKTRGGGTRGSGEFGAAYHAQYHGPSKNFERDVASNSTEGGHARWGSDQHGWSEHTGIVRVQNCGLENEGGSRDGEIWRASGVGLHGAVQGVFPDEPRLCAANGSSRSHGLSSGGGRGYGGLQKQTHIPVAGERKDWEEEGRGSYRRVVPRGGSSRHRQSFGGQVVQRGTIQAGDDLFGAGGELQAFGTPKYLNRSKAVKLVSPKEDLGQQWGKNNTTSIRSTHDVRGNSFKNRDGNSSWRNFPNEKTSREEVEVHWQKASNDQGYTHEFGKTSLGATKEEFPRGRFVVYEIPGEEVDWKGGKAISNGTRNGRHVVGSSLKCSGRQMQRARSPSPIFQLDKRGRRIDVLPKARDGASGTFSISTPSSSSRGSSSSRTTLLERDLIERKLDESGEMFIVSPNSSRGRNWSRNKSFDRKKREDCAELPIFSPTSVDIETEIEGPELSSSALHAYDDSGLKEGEEGWNATKQLPGKAWESVGGGMHRTRSTDWYEICLKEEEEETEERQERAKASEQSKALGENGENPTKSASFSRRTKSGRKLGEYVSLNSSVDPQIKREINVERGRLHESIVRENAVDAAQPNISSVERTTDSNSSEDLFFTPWNSLQTGSSSNVRNAPRPRSLAQQFERISGETRHGAKQQSMQVVLSGRRVIPSKEQERRTPGESSEGGGRHEALRESVAGGQVGLGRGVSDPVHNRDSESREGIREDGTKRGWRQSSRGAPTRGLTNPVGTEEGKRQRPQSKEGGLRSKGLQEPTAGCKGVLGIYEIDDTENCGPGRQPESLCVESIVGELRGVPLNDANATKGLASSGEPYASRPGAIYRAYNDREDEPLPHIVGTCPNMCPEKERLQRERLRDLAVFERVNGNMRITSKDLAVKKFCRTVVASELEQSNVRPLPVLWKTLQYLLRLLDDPEFSFDIIHDFLFDRTRAIRQELGMQRVLNQQSITIHEEIVRFHILSEHELREQNRKKAKQFDTHLNLQQLSKSLYSLLNLYISLGGDGEVQFENEAEFHAYYVLLNLGDHDRFQAEPLSLWFPNVPAHVLRKDPMQFARKALRFYRSSNFVGFFRLVKEATYLQGCLLELNFASVRATTLAMLNAAEYKIHPFPFSDLAQLLILEENEVEELCMFYGLVTGIDNSSQKRCLLVKQAQFTAPETGCHPQFSCRLIDSKRAQSHFREVKGACIQYDKSRIT